ncbi:MAG: hypothetical protein IT545_10345 [Rhodobacteraceae bacterium]|nr:hypothetical protein [Paracoccaceae bacterium]
MDASRRAASLVRAALIAAIAVPGVPAGAEGTGPDGSGGATGDAAAEAIVRGGAIAAFASVSEDSSKTAWTLGKTYVPVDGMTLTVRARRRSMLVITFTAECKAYPPDSDPGAAVAVFVEARVNGARVPG